VSAHIGLTVGELAELGVRRVSLGSALARAAWTGFLRAARGVAEGNFAALQNLATTRELSDFFS
jgi:2-methylisocitrate lyase-like PEP mutase family enzyme